MKLWVRLGCQDIQVIGEEVISKFPELPGLQQDPHLGVCVFVCLSLTSVYQALSGSSYLVALRFGFTRSYLRSGYSVPWNYIFYEYRTRATNHRVVSFLHKIFSASAYVKIDFIKPYKHYIAPCSCRLSKLEVRKKYLFSKTRKIEDRRIFSMRYNHLQQCEANPLKLINNCSDIKIRFFW